MLERASIWIEFEREEPQMEPQLILEIWKKRWQIPLTKEKEAEFKSKVVFFGLDKFDRTR